MRRERRYSLRARSGRFAMSLSADGVLSMLDLMRGVTAVSHTVGTSLSLAMSSDGEHVSILRLASVEVIKLANASTKTFEVGPAADVAHAAGSPDRSATIFGCIKAVFCYLRTITPRVSLSVLVSSHQSRFSSFPTVCAISELKFVFFPKRYQSGLIKSIVYP